ncbi:MAG: M3 family metallopeptidase [Candidatus Aminicenantes bacterium]|nr:MAG: M3 family metallopeptidase [Candidatus Aminicenantes bacterium]
MKKSLLLLVVLGLLFFSCSKKEDISKKVDNPFFNEFDTPFNVPPFDEINEEHYLPAFKEAMKQQQQEIAVIVDNSNPPTFENILEALEESGALLRKVSSVFGVLNSSMTNERMQEIAKEAAPLRSKHRDDIRLNEKLFQRIKAVYDQKDELDLTLEQNTLLEKYYKDFVRGGANLDEEKKTKLRGINQELSLLTLKFGENILKENNRFEMVIEEEEDLAGLPQAVISGAVEAAEERDHKSKWVFTLHKPSMIPFLQYSERRELREKIFKGYINRGNNNDELDNKAILSKIAALRVERANLLGYKSHADFILENNMAKKPENVYNLLYQLWKPALKIAKNEAKELQAMIHKEGKDFKLQPWDWWHYAEKLKKAKYELEEEILRQYFKLENVRDGAFYVANKLFGLQFIERDDIPKYHEDVRVFEVKEADGSHVGILYTDYFPRASKRGGAWMNSFRKQYRLDGKEVHPVITNNGNFSKPTGGKPALISIEEVSTLFHEFGHALHGLLSNCTYNRLSGTSVPRDFVELPSQIMENWVTEPEVLRVYAKHYETGEVIPQELVDKIKKAGHFNQGFATVEYLAASFLDMDWHTLIEAKELDPIEFENESLEKIGLIPEIVVRYRSPYFSHVFSGGYSSGYYSYIWAEVLDADAFEAFKETSLFDQKTALSFRKNILEVGGKEDPMILYKRFRGADPKVEPLLKKRGLY